MRAACPVLAGVASTLEGPWHAIHRQPSRCARWLPAQLAGEWPGQVRHLCLSHSLRCITTLACGMPSSLQMHDERSALCRRVIQRIQGIIEQEGPFPGDAQRKVMLTGTHGPECKFVRRPVQKALHQQSRIAVGPLHLRIISRSYAWTALALFREQGTGLEARWRIWRRLTSPKHSPA